MLVLCFPRCQECPKSFAHHGNLLRHMQLHDPDNPDYHVKGEGYSEEEEEEEEDEEDMLDEGQTVIQEGQPPQQVQVSCTQSVRSLLYCANSNTYLATVFYL